MMMLLERNLSKGMMIRKKLSSRDSRYSKLELFLSSNTINSISYYHFIRRGILHEVNSERPVLDIWRDIKSIILNRRY